MRQQVEILIVASIDTDDDLREFEQEMRYRIEVACDELLGMQSLEDVQIEYGEPV